jgi:hypothetical protein
MEQEVLKNFSRARSHKKIAFVEPSCANAKLDSPYLGDKIDTKKFSKSYENKKVSIYLLYYKILT